MTPIAYENTPVWRRAMRLVRSLYRLSRRFPDDEKSGLTATVRRTATGMLTAIAHAGSRLDNDQLAKCYDDLQSTLCELDAAVQISRRLGYTRIWHTWPIHRALEDFAVMLEREHGRIAAPTVAAAA